MSISDKKEMPPITNWRKTKKYLYDIRWFFIYENGSVKRGAWTNTPPLASDQTHESLSCAGIEINNKLTNELDVLTKADVGEFNEFRWIGTASIPLGSIANLDGKIKMKPSIEGITLVKNDGSKFTFYIDGTIEN